LSCTCSLYIVIKDFTPVSNIIILPSNSHCRKKPNIPCPPKGQNILHIPACVKNIVLLRACASQNQHAITTSPFKLAGNSHANRFQNRFCRLTRGTQLCPCAHNFVFIAKSSAIFSINLKFRAVILIKCLRRFKLFLSVHVRSL
jgi:hypothetical protein